MAFGYVRHHHSKRKFKMISFRAVTRSVLNHPFLMIMLLFLIFLHHYFPFLFSLLVTASPVLICTAILLGTLLIHGKPNDRNVNYHDEMSYNYTPMSSRNGSTDREGTFSKDMFSEVRNGIIEKGARYISKAEKSKNDFGSSNFEDLFDRDCDRSIKVQEDDGLSDQYESCLGQKELLGEALRQECSDYESDGAEKYCLDAVVAGDILSAQETHHLLDSQDTLHVDAHHDDDHQSSDDGNDGHVDEEDIPKHNGNGGSMTNAWMEMEKTQQLESLITKTGDEDQMDHDDDDDDDDEGIDDVVDDDDDDDDDEGENTDVEKDGLEHVTMWTEEDEKNLRLVGNSELERDLRLENLLARRRVRRNFSVISEKNLVNLDRHDRIPLQVPHISTTRVNPFDINQDHFSSMLSVPGSAPSVNIPRKNPFDSPCTSPKNVQNLTEEIPEENAVQMNSNNTANEIHEYDSKSSVTKSGFLETNRKDAVFRRYDSFSIGYNIPEEIFSQSNFMETDHKIARLKRWETFNARSGFSSSLHQPEKLSILRMKPVFVREQVRDQEVSYSSGKESSHDSESFVASESDIEDAGPNKDLEEDSEDIHSLHDDLEEGFVASSLEANAKLNADHIYQKVEASIENHDNKSSRSNSMISELVQCSEKIGEDDDDIAKVIGFPIRTSSNMSDAITEPPVFDSSPSSVEKITPFSTSPKHD